MFGLFGKKEEDKDIPSIDENLKLTERQKLSKLFSYREFIDEHKLILLDDGREPAVGFVLKLNPLLSVGLDAEPQFEAVINSCPVDSILQFSVLSTPQIRHIIDRWAKSRVAENDSPLLKQVAFRRRDFMLKTATSFSMLPNERIHPRDIQYFLSVRIPFKGDVSSELELNAFLREVIDRRNVILGALTGASSSGEVMDEKEIKILIRELVNPHFSPDDRLKGAINDESKDILQIKQTRHYDKYKTSDESIPFNPEDKDEHMISSHKGIPAYLDLVERETRLRVLQNGYLAISREGETYVDYSSEENSKDTLISCITVDQYPQEVYLPLTSILLGDPSSRTERIKVPFWAYTTIHILNPEVAKDKATAKLGALNKQTMSESPWFRSMMGHLITRKEEIENMVSQTKNGHQFVRMYTGINLYCSANQVKQETEYVKGLWRKAGFRASQEVNITMPVWLSSFPLQYCPHFDDAGKGLQRAITVHSLHAAAMVFIQGDWIGTDPQEGGPLMISRRGRLATFDLFKSSTNYNFCVIAASGSGKSFLTNEIVADFLSKNGLVRIIDVGRSYFRFCEINKGQNLIFDPKKPKSMNPFSDISTLEDLNESMDLLKPLVMQMAYPLRGDADDWEYQLIEKVIIKAWYKAMEEGEICDIRTIYDVLKEHPDARASDIADQLEPYSHGRFKDWFLGPREVELNNKMVVLELEELNSNKELRAVILTLCINMISKEMYLSGRETKKLLAIDEAWDLLGDAKAGKFIETAFRRARKYNGSAGVITQAFSDFEKTPAAKAAIDNSSWNFILFQRSETIDQAAKTGMIQNNAYLIKLMKTVKSGMGFSEVYVKSADGGEGIYRFVTDRHSYYTYTTNPKDINQLTNLTNSGMTIEEAIDKLATDDYVKMWGENLDASLG